VPGEYSSLTGGAFDVTIAPFLDLYRHHAAEDGSFPSAEAVAAARSLVDYRALRLDGVSITLERPGWR